MARLKQPHVLIMTASFGAGHMSVSASLKSAFAVRGVTDVAILDFYELVSPLFNKVSRFVYTTGTTWTPALYGAAYKKVDSLAIDSWVHAAADRFGREELAAKVRVESPDIVIFTYPAPGGILAELRQNRLFHGLMATVITDYTVHTGWLHNPVDLYLVAHSRLKADMADRGIDRSRIEVTGIPIDTAFGAGRLTSGGEPDLPIDEPDNKPVLLFATHGYRTSDAFNITRALLRAAPGAQIVVLYRQNELLARRLAGLADSSRLTLLSYASRMEALLGRADVLVSKAGGLTMTEAMVSRLPVVVFRPVPGQEKENAIFMAGAGTALVAGTISELEAAVALILSDPTISEQMRDAAGQTVWRDSADRAVAAVLNHYEMMKQQGKIGETNAATREPDTYPVGQLRGRPQPSFPRPERRDQE